MTKEDKDSKIVGFIDELGEVKEEIREAQGDIARRVKKISEAGSYLNKLLGDPEHVSRTESMFSYAEWPTKQHIIEGFSRVNELSKRLTGI